VKILLITNVPSPYRSKQFNLIGDNLGNNFLVFYTSSNFSVTKMKWDRPELTHSHKFLDQNNKFTIVSYISLLKILNRENPDILVTSGFNIIMVSVFIFAKCFNKKHIVFTDSWLYPISKLSSLHRIIRKIIIKKSDGFICVGNKGKTYLEKYGAESKKIFISRLSDEINYRNSPELKKEYDIVFSGQIIKRKQPLFFVDVAYEIAKDYPKLRVLILGTGPLESEMIERLQFYKIDFRFEGYIKPEDIKEYYVEAKILLFPTLNDPWGMVANDALSLGLPVITTPYAGCADDLIIHNYNGFVLELNKIIWKNHVISLLNDEIRYKEMSNNCIKSIQEFTPEKSAADFIAALKAIEK
jgi:glycosyltransferase involved in cell wall biosynthesis